MINTRADVRDLAADLARPPYRFVEHELAIGAASPVLRHPEDHRTFVVIGGRVRLESAEPGGVPREYGYLRGWHALPDATYRFVNSGAVPAVVVEAGSINGPTLEEADFTVSQASGACIVVDSYRVDKPWGHEVWYTHNVPNLPYALKQIHMTAGHQSSLQSHEYKIETNYVVDGEATVLNGTRAPANRNSVIDIGALPRAVYHRRSGWSSERNVLHRVIAHETYTSVEVSTPELDDVIRWADDTNRGNGRVAAEHQGGVAMTVTDDIRLYLDEQKAILESFPVEQLSAAAEMLFTTYERGGTVYAMGNGGNAGTLDHAYCDFKHHPFVSEDKTEPVSSAVKRLTFVNLCGSAAEISGLVNDLGAEEMYSASVEPFATERDLVMAYSGSGNSANVVRALEAAVKAGARTFAMTKGDGGRCRQLAEVCLIVPGTSQFPGQTGKNDNNFHFEDLMLSVNHILVGLLKRRVARQLPVTTGEG